MKEIIEILDDLRMSIYNRVLSGEYETDREKMRITALKRTISILKRIEHQEVVRRIADHWFLPAHSGIQQARDSVVEFIKGDDIEEMSDYCTCYEPNEVLGNICRTCRRPVK